MLNNSSAKFIGGFIIIIFIALIIWFTTSYVESENSLKVGREKTEQVSV